MSMYVDLIKDQENTIILLCQHLQKCITLLEAYADMDDEEKFLAETMKKQGIESEDTEK